VGSPWRRGRELPQQAGTLHCHDRARSGRRRRVRDQPQGIRHQSVHLGSAGQVKPTKIQNPAGINVTAYCIGGAGEDHVTIINKAHGAGAADAAVTIVPPDPGWQSASVMTLAGAQPRDARGTSATLGGATITGGTPWNGTWNTLPAGLHAGISLTVRATTAAIVKIQSGR
jgi:hypothetical protein